MRAARLYRGQQAVERLRLDDGIGEDDRWYPGFGEDQRLAGLGRGDAACTACQLLPRDIEALVRFHMRKHRDAGGIGALRHGLYVAGKARLVDFDIGRRSLRGRRAQEAFDFGLRRTVVDFCGRVAGSVRSRQRHF
ncbi:hypothetical protein D3C87_1778060 [compost metagenome]